MTQDLIFCDRNFSDWIIYLLQKKGKYWRRIIYTRVCLSVFMSIKGFGSFNCTHLFRMCLYLCICVSVLWLSFTHLNEFSFRQNWILLSSMRTVGRNERCWRKRSSLLLQKLLKVLRWRHNSFKDNAWPICKCNRFPSVHELIPTNCWFQDISHNLNIS